MRAILILFLIFTFGCGRDAKEKIRGKGNGGGGSGPQKPVEDDYKDIFHKEFTEDGQLKQRVLKATCVEPRPGGQKYTMRLKLKEKKRFELTVYQYNNGSSRCTEDALSVDQADDIWTPSEPTRALALNKVGIFRGQDSKYYIAFSVTPSIKFSDLSNSKVFLETKTEVVGRNGHN